MRSMTTELSAPAPNPPRDTGRVHILGLGSIGTFAAHSVSEIPHGPSVSLLLHRQSLLDAYHAQHSRILFQSADGKNTFSQAYDIETFRDGQWFHSQPTSSPDPIQPATEAIQNLIISVKATQTVSALRPLRERLSSNSTILFLQNGAGMIEEVNAYLFPNPSARPSYLIGVISHGVTLNAPFNITHTGFSATSIGPVPREDSKPLSTSSKYLLKILPKSPTLNTTAYEYQGVLQGQLEKLAVNAFCNPLCALNDAKNGFLFTIPKTRRKILTEISQVVLALPQLNGVPGVEERFNVDKLEETVNRIIENTRNTTCSMVWDLRAGRKTEVQFINGAWSRMGREVGIETPVNDWLLHAIETRCGKEASEDGK